MRCGKIKSRDTANGQKCIEWFDAWQWLFGRCRCRCFSCYYCCGCHSNVSVQTSCNDAVLRTKAAKSTSSCHFVQITRNKKAKACESRNIYGATVSDERWASPYFAATVTSERTEIKSARQSERGRCIQVHIHNKNVQWVSGCCVNCAGACIHILNSWRCTIAYFVYLSWISWNENTHSISKHTVPFHSLSPITITIIIIFS